MRNSSAPSGKHAAVPARRRRRRSTAGRRPAAAGGRGGSRLFRRWGLGQLVALTVAAAILSLAVNWIYQVARKPSELLFPVAGALTKTPAETWARYAPLFRKYSTATISPGLLAAIAQTEAAGNPLARTYWRWSWTARPFDIYRPASSSVGMYQMTDGNFAQAKQLCIHDHIVVPTMSGNDGASCWFNGLYSRVLPADAIELTSAYLDRAVAVTLARDRIAFASPRQLQHLAAAIHLCGAHAGELYARNGFRFAAGQRCGEHDPRAYLARVEALEAEFSRMAPRG